MGVLFIGPKADSQVDAVTRELETRGVETTLWDASSWPGEMQATVRQAADETRVTIDDTAEISAAYHTIYLRQLGLDPRYPAFESDFEERPLSVINQLREYRGLLLSAINCLQEDGCE